MVSGSGISSNSLPNILLIVTDQLRFDAFNPQIMYHLSRVDSNTNTTTLFTNAFVSTPSCTPARAALLTGRSTWNHGMLGYDAGVSCENYTTTLPSVLADYLGYKTIVVGKNHFGTKEKEDQQQQQQHRHREFITHGYQNMKLYEGLTFDENINIEDDYNTFFNNTFPGIDPLSTCDLGWNDWNACPYKFDEHIHPTSWTTRQVLNIIDDNEHFLDYSDDNDHPIFLKVSYHRPHSPYDPPKRL
ncbi:alkaline phosphatase-like protein, partial [Fragilariopsis cylindrus CCMP1102]